MTKKYHNIFRFVIACIVVIGIFFICGVALHRMSWHGKKNSRAGSMKAACTMLEIIGVQEDSGDILCNPVVYSPEGEELGSWRFYITWLINSGGEESESPYSRSEPWTQRECQQWQAREWCWIESTTGETRYWTNVMAVVGPDTGFDLRYRDKLQDCEDLIVLIEVKDSGVHWAEPGDLHIDDIKPEVTQGIDGDGVLVCFLDGQVWFLRHGTPVEIIKVFCTATGARQHDREQILTKYGHAIIE